VNLVNKKLRGEKVPYERTNWLKPSQEQLIRAIYLACGRQANEWCTTAQLLRQTQYHSPGSLWTALRTLQGHKVIEMKRQRNVCSLRLACNCVIETDKGELLIAAGKILDAEKPKRASEKG
jgi:hypothetical protein